MNGLTILRRVEGLWPETEAALRGDPRRPETSELIEFNDGSTWVLNDQPWDADTGHQIVTHTKEFIVVDDQFNRVYGPVRDLKKAEAAIASAKVTITPVIEMDDDEDESDTTAASE